MENIVFPDVYKRQGIELGYWKRGIPATLSLLKDAVKEKSAVNVSFSIFAKSAIDNSDKKQSTKDNLHSTLADLHDFCSGLDFKDLTYTFFRNFEPVSYTHLYEFTWWKYLGK